MRNLSESLKRLLFGRAMESIFKKWKKAFSGFHQEGVMGDLSESLKRLLFGRVMGARSLPERIKKISPKGLI
jgi:hypothetical protein